MSFRNVFISNLAKVSTRNNQLVITQEDETKIPIEDIDSIVIESQGVQISCSALSQCAENNVVVFVCDAKHLPNSVLLPFATHSRHLSMISKQIGITRPRKKQLWQQIIRQKVRNQAECVKCVFGENYFYNQLMTCSNNVLSGDSTYIEGRAAALYFKGLFGKDFTREKPIKINSCLNYGYAIIRGIVARTIVAHGFEPSIGLFHHSQLNSFNLADDLFEPFRPLVDSYVAQHYMADDATELMREDKINLYNLINYSIISGKQKHNITNAAERLVESYARSLAGKVELVLPELIPLCLHEYE